MRKGRIYLDSQLMDYYQSGLKVDVGDISVTEENLDAMNRIVQEENCYMKDFEENEKGDIYRIHYIKVTEY